MKTIYHKPNTVSPTACDECLSLWAQVPTFLAVLKLAKPNRKFPECKNIISKIIKSVAFLVITEKTVET